jgi:hypothetical protein
MSSSARVSGRKPYPHQVLLNGADGMDWETFCDCSIMYAVRSDLLFNKRGRVSLERRLAIRATSRTCFGCGTRIEQILGFEGGSAQMCQQLLC